MSLESREVRGWCLKICERAQPYGASFRLIDATLAEAGFHTTLTEIKSHLKYLEEKGYIRTEEIVKNNIKRRINYITPKGVDLLEGNIDPDPGVLLNG